MIQASIKHFSATLVAEVHKHGTVTSISTFFTRSGPLLREVSTGTKVVLDNGVLITGVALHLAITRTSVAVNTLFIYDAQWS